MGSNAVADAISRINVNDESCSNHFIQYGALEALTGDLAGHHQIIATLKEWRDVAVGLLNSIPGVKCYRPNATFYLFPNVTGLMLRKGFDDYEMLRRKVLQDTGVSFCTRWHCGKVLPGETRKYIRLAYSGVDAGDSREGLAKFKQWAES